VFITVTMITGCPLYGLWKLNSRENHSSLILTIQQLATDRRTDRQTDSKSITV